MGGTNKATDYGEPWTYDLDETVAIGNGGEAQIPVFLFECHARRAVACVNALAGIENPQAVRAVIAAARNVCAHPLSPAHVDAMNLLRGTLDVLDGRLHDHEDVRTELGANAGDEKRFEGVT